MYMRERIARSASGVNSDKKLIFGGVDDTR
jgi:hypothetical protein